MKITIPTEIDIPAGVFFYDVGSSVIRCEGCGRVEERLKKYINIRDEEKKIVSNGQNTGENNDQ